MAPKQMAEKTSKAKARHGLFDSAGNATDDIEQASGISYQVLSATGDPVGEPLTLDLDDLPAPMVRMLAIFGARTRVVNDASAVRQQGGEAEEQWQAVADAFAALRAGRWRAARSAPGPRIDLDVLADAIVAVAEQEGHVQLSDRDGVRGKIDGEAGLKLRDTLRAYPPIAAEYARRIAERRPGALRPGALNAGLADLIG